MLLEVSDVCVPLYGGCVLYPACAYVAPVG